MPPARGAKFAKPKNLKGTLGFLMKYLKKYIPLLIIVFICIVASAFGSTYATTYLSQFIDAIKDILALKANDPSVVDGVSISWSYLFHSDLGLYIIKMAICYIISMVTAYLYQRLMIIVSTGAMKNVRDDLFTHVEKLPIRYFDNTTHGDIMSRFTNDTDALRELLSNGIPQFLSSVFQVVFVFTFMIKFSIPLTFITIIALVGMIFIIKAVAGKSRKYFIANQQILGKANGYIEEMIEGAKVVKVFTHEQETKDNFHKINEDLCSASTNANTYGMILFPIMGNLSNVLYAIIGILGAILVYYTDSGAITSKFIAISIGSMIGFLTYVKKFTQPISQFSQQMNAVFSAMAGIERIYNVMKEEPEVDEGYVKLVNAKIDDNGNISEVPERTGIWAWKHTHSDGCITYAQLKGDVVFENVTFSYVPNKVVLKNIDLYARPGQKIALVGSTGAGKTTITNLINRFYDIDSGKIRYDGINISKICKDDLRKSLSMVLQDTHLFTGTIMENIRYGKLDATDEECIAAAKLANADWFISHLPDGYNTMLTGDGANLSQGQRQLINIARAAVANPPVLILDEATSSIDTRTEAIIQKGMDQLMAGRTVFVIAHRLSTVRNSDAIMVLEHGEIIERGNHESLLAQKGRYYQLYTGKAELD